MNNQPAFSIITPSYNRKHTLKKVYEGLLRQTFTDFEWIIVDDGSNDRTFELVEAWSQYLSIVYKFKENGGKSSAVNFGISIAKGRYIVVLDSDDVPIPEAISIFNKEFETTDDDICAVGALTMTVRSQIIGSELGRPIEHMTMLEAYSRHGMKGDKWLAFKAEVAKRFLSPKYDSEKFVPEALVFNRISRYGYKTRFINRPLLIHEYLPDGLSSNYLKLKINNPIGFISYYFENISAGDAAIKPFYLKSAANIYVTLLIGSKRPLVTVVLMVIALPMGLVKYFFDIPRLKKLLKSEPYE